MIIERLSRKLLGLDYGRGSEITGTYPQQTFLGHLAALCNGTTASDGDIFSYMFKQAKLGPLIGTRTWGGVVGINGWGPAIDGGEIFVPQFATANAEGQYVIEGHGVDPDIVVEQDVRAQLAGKDPQLDRAIEELQKAIQAAPVKLPPRPAESGQGARRHARGGRFGLARRFYAVPALAGTVKRGARCTASFASYAAFTSRSVQCLPIRRSSRCFRITCGNDVTTCTSVCRSCCSAVTVAFGSFDAERGIDRVGIGLHAAPALPQRRRAQRAAAGVAKLSGEPPWNESSCDSPRAFGRSSIEMK